MIVCPRTGSGVWLRRLKAGAMLGLALALLAASGCSRVTIRTVPPGAQITCSDNGLPPWQPWHPEKGKNVSPSTTTVWGGTLRFFRTEKEGYYLSEPKLVDGFMFNIDHVDFELEPSPELVAQEKRAQGLIWWEPDKAWVNPTEKGLVEYKGEWLTAPEKLARERKDAGMVEYNGQWVTPEERDRLFAESQKAAGLVLYRGQWIKAVEEVKQKQIDAIVAETATSGTLMKLPPIGTMPRPLAKKTELKISNGTRSLIHVYFSGSTSFETPVDGFNLQNIEIAPGHYRIAVVPELHDEPTQVGEATFEDQANRDNSVAYSLDYQGDPGSLLRRIKEEKPVDLQMPQIVIPEIQLPAETEEEAASQPTPEEQAKAAEIMAKVRSGELTMDQAREQLPASVLKQMEKRRGGQEGGRRGGDGGPGGPQGGDQGGGQGEGAAQAGGPRGGGGEQGASAGGDQGGSPDAGGGGRRRGGGGGAQGGKAEGGAPAGDAGGGAPAGGDQGGQ